MSPSHWDTDVQEYAVDEFIHETDAAWLLRLSDVDEELWFPKSKCEFDEESMTIDVPDWLAEEKEIL